MAPVVAALSEKRHTSCLVVKQLSTPTLKPHPSCEALGFGGALLP